MEIKDVPAKIEEYKKDVEKIVNDVIALVNKVDADLESLSNIDKPKLIEEVSKVIDDMVKLNPVLEMIDGMAIKTILSMLLKNVGSDDLQKLLHKKLF